MANGLFDPGINLAGWFDDDLALAGWFDDSLLGPAAGPATHATSGALTGQGSAVAGVVSRFRALASSGALSGQGSSIVGAASRTGAVVTHATSGALTGQGSTVSGASARTRAHPSSGVLAGPGAAVAGAAARFRAFASSGALTGQGAALSGEATNFTPHSTSGVLVGGGAALAGTAARSTGAVSHDTSGELVGAGSVLAGDAANGTAPRNAGFEMGGRKVYIKRGKRIHIFDTVEDADEWEAAQQVIPHKPSRNAKKRALRAVDRFVPHEVVVIDGLEAAVQRFGIPVELPTLEARQDWMEVARIALMAKHLQDEEEIELLLMA